MYISVTHVYGRFSVSPLNMILYGCTRVLCMICQVCDVPAQVHVEVQCLHVYVSLGSEAPPRTRLFAASVDPLMILMRVPLDSYFFHKIHHTKTKSMRNIN